MIKLINEAFKGLEDKLLEPYISYLPEHLKEALIELNSTVVSELLYEDRTNTEYIKRNLAGKFISQGGIDARGTKIDSLDDLAQFVKIFRDTRYEIFRIFYIKDKTIVGSDAITSKLPDASTILRPNKTAVSEYDDQWRTWHYYSAKKQKLNADGYYLCHNHPSGNVNPSRADLHLTEIFKGNISGFKGHIVIGRDKFGFIDSELNYKVYDYEELINKAHLDTIYNVDDLFKVGRDFRDSGSSVVFYCNNMAEITDIQLIKNSEFADKDIIGYLNNQRLANGAVSVFIYTEDENVLAACEQGVYQHVITDAVFFDSKTSKFLSARQLFISPLDSNNPLTRAKVKRFAVSEPNTNYKIF